MPGTLDVTDLITNVAGIFGNPFVAGAFLLLAAIKLFPRVTRSIGKGAGVK